MKTNLSVRIGIVALSALALCCFSSAFAQAESKKKKTGIESSSAAAGEARSSLSDGDKKFVRKAAKGGAMEVEMGKMASEKAENDDVKSFGKRMIEDHTKMGDELKSVAQKKGAKLPEKKAEVSWKSDKAYMDDMVKDHEKDLAEFQKAAKESQDSDLKEFAEKSAKVIEEHLKLAKEVEAKLK